MEYTVSDKYKKEYDKLMSEAPFERDIQKTLEEWYILNRTCKIILRLDGARQVGKTTELLKFGYRNYKNILYINLAEPDVIVNFYNILQKDKNYISGMHEYFGDYVDNESTLFIIDEIQLSSDIYNSLKEFKRQLSCDIIVTGSYLGRVIHQELYLELNELQNNSYFAPVGAIYSITMHPLTFKEFCKAMGMQKLLDKQMQEFSLGIDLQQGDCEKLYMCYDLYNKIGGYPVVINLYIKFKNFALCYNMLNSILDTFKEESLGYYTDDNKVLIFDEIYEIILKLMMKADKPNNFSIELITSEIKSKHKDLTLGRSQVNKALNWVISSGLLGVCHRYNNGKYDDVTYNAKLYFRDTGILNLISNDMSIDEAHLKGLQTETFAFNELSHNCVSYFFQSSLVRESIPYYAKFGDYELDFVLHGSKLGDFKDTIFGIEIKSGEGSHKSLDFFKKKGVVNKSIVANRSTDFTKKTRSWTELPIYLVGIAFPYERESASKIDKLDLF